MLIVHRVHRDGRNAAVQYSTQEQLRNLLDRWGHTRMVYYTHTTLHAVIHCATVDENRGLRDISVVVHKGTIGVDRLQQLLQWMDHSGYAASYTPMRLTTMPPQPNSGSCRSHRDIARWCDGTVDALMRYHVIVNLMSPDAVKDKNGPSGPPDGDRSGQHVSAPPG